MYCDLHFHTYFSADALSVPEAVPVVAKQSGCMALACTDHDALEANPIMEQCASENGVAFITGVELDAIHPVYGHLHILGFGIDYNNAALNAICNTEIAAGNRFYEALRDAYIDEGVIPDIAEFEAFAFAGHPQRRIGIKHVLRWLVERGVADSMPMARDIAEKRLAGIKNTHTPPSARAVIDTIQSAGGLAILAHPAGGSGADDLEKLIEELLADGCAGVEVFTPSNKTPERVEAVRQIAESHKVLMTGGSDYHGGSSIEKWPSIAPYSCYEALKDALGS